MKQSRLFLKWRPNLDDCCRTCGYCNCNVVSWINIFKSCIFVRMLGKFIACWVDIRTLKLNISSVALKWTEHAFNDQYLHNIERKYPCSIWSRPIVSFNEISTWAPESKKYKEDHQRYWGHYGEEMVKETWIFFQRWRSGRAGKRSAWVDCLPGVRRLQGVLQTSLRNGGCQPFWTPVTKWSPRFQSPPILQRLRQRPC